MPYDWNNPYDSVIAYDVGNPQTATLLGIASGEHVGGTGGGSSTRGPTFNDSTCTFNDPYQTFNASINAVGFPSQLMVLAPALITLSGIASAASFGNIVVIAPGTIALSGIPSAESFGVIHVSQVLRPAVTAARVL